MKTAIVVLIVLFASITFADPRIEINDNFCHFILDPVNTDNEIFVGGCNGKIVSDGAGTANGYIRIFKWMSREEAGVLLGDKRNYSFTSAESATPCVLVDSNGTEYNSEDWESSVIYKRGSMIYKLICYGAAEAQQ